MTRKQIINRAEQQAARAGLQDPKVYTRGAIFPKCFMTANVNGERQQVSGNYTPSQILAIYTEQNNTILNRWSK